MEFAAFLRRSIYSLPEATLQAWNKALPPADFCGRKIKELSGLKEI